MDTIDLKLKAEYARDMYKMGKISREEAKKEIEPYIEAVNQKMVELAKKYNQKPKKINIQGFLR